MKLFLIGIISICAFGLKAQNEIARDFIQMSKHYADLKKFSLNINVNYIGNDGKTIFKQSGLVASGKDFHYTKFAGTTSLIIDKKALLINQEQKYIVYNEFEEGYEKQMDNSSFQIEATIDSLWKAQENFKYTYLNAPKGKKRIYIEDSGNPDYYAYTITMEASSGKLLEYIYHVKSSEERDLAEVRIFYLNENNAPKFKEEIYSISYYLKSMGNTLTPASKFAEYKVIDQRQIKL